MPEPALKTIGRGLRLLDHFAEQPWEHTLSTLSRELGLSKAVLQRLLTALHAHGYVVQDPITRRYRLGASALRLGTLRPRLEDLRPLALEAMKGLAERTGLSCFLTAPFDDEAVCVGKVEPNVLIRVSYNVGRRHPYHAGAPGKALLAFLPAERRETLLSAELERYTDHTIISRESLLAELARIRDDGFAISHEELAVGVSGAAAVVLDPLGEPLASVSLAGPTRDVDDAQLRARGRELVDVATQLSARLGRAT
ncbi:IclR family transcriptional regulator, partial [bacterium]